MSLVCEYMDAAIGMGYGTTLTPVLLLLGLPPLVVVPSVLVGQLVGGITGGFTHWRIGNISTGSDAKIILFLIAFGVVGAIFGAYCAVSISTLALNIYIGSMVLAMGLLILWQRNKVKRMSWKVLSAVGVLSAFNKGISGGGYGPLVTGGQIISGRKVKSSIGSTTLAEVPICAIALLFYFLLANPINGWIILATCCGAGIAGPLAALTVRKVSSKHLVFFVSILTILLGVFTLIRVFI